MRQPARGRTHAAPQRGAQALATRAFGQFSARGGAQGGDGGLIETSGGWLDARPAGVDTKAPKGRAGTWLIDPYDITISDAVSDTNVAVTSGNYSPTGSGTTLNALTLASILDAGVNVNVSTSAGGGSEAGDITLSAATIVTSAASPGTLTLSAYQNGNTVLVELEDDGQGIDPEKIKEVALKRGFVSPETLAEMSPSQVIQIIFQPGFSASISSLTPT